MSNAFQKNIAITGTVNITHDQNVMNDLFVSLTIPEAEILIKSWISQVLKDGYNEPVSQSSELNFSSFQNQEALSRVQLSHH